MGSVGSCNMIIVPIRCRGISDCVFSILKLIMDRLPSSMCVTVCLMMFDIETGRSLFVILNAWWRWRLTMAVLIVEWKVIRENDSSGVVDWCWSRFLMLGICWDDRNGQWWAADPFECIPGYPGSNPGASRRASRRCLTVPHVTVPVAPGALALPPQIHLLRSQDLAAALGRERGADESTALSG